MQHIESRRMFLILNTHMDDQGSISRLEAAKIIENIAISKAKIGQGSLPVVLTGDFNSSPDQEAYQYLTSQASFVDTSNLLASSRHYGDSMTFTGFMPDIDTPRKIDFIFTKIDSASTMHFNVENHAVLPNRFDDGGLYSDLRAVVADLVLKDRPDH